MIACIGSLVRAAAEPRAIDHKGPDDAPHRAAHDVTEHLLNGRITSAPTRKQLRDALDHADKTAERTPDLGRVFGRRCLKAANLLAQGMDAIAGGIEDGPIPPAEAVKVLRLYAAEARAVGAS